MFEDINMYYRFFILVNFRERINLVDNVKKINFY